MIKDGARQPWELTMVGKIVGAVMIGLMSWMAISVQQMSVDVAVMKEQIDTATEDRFRKADGLLLKAQIEQNAKRLDALEERQ